VGQRPFPVAIRARTPAARVDWRRDYGSLDYETVELPQEVAAGLRSYLKAADLAFAAFDLVRTTAGEHYFLEANANGEWGGSPMPSMCPSPQRSPTRVTFDGTHNPWQTAETAHQTWTRLGRPALSTLGLTVTPTSNTCGANTPTATGPTS
jgi:hypothetical protein